MIEREKQIVVYNLSCPYNKIKKGCFVYMDFSNFATIIFMIISLFTIVLSISFWMIAIKVLEKLDKFLDLKIIETEIKIDKF